MSEELTVPASSLGLGGSAPGDFRPAANVHIGSGLGLGIKNVSIDAATPLVLPPVTIVVLQTPTMFKKRTGISNLIKTLCETCATNVSGIDIQYNVETGESPYGHDGQPVKVPTQTKRSEVTPSFTFPELTGNIVWETFGRWAFAMNHPDGNNYAYHQLDNDVNPFVASAYSMSMAAIQFDASGLPENILGGAFYSNMFPTDPGGGFGLERQIGQSKTMERTVTFTGHVRHNWKTRELLVQLANNLGLGKARLYPENAPQNPGYDTSNLAGLRSEIDAIEDLPAGQSTIFNDNVA